MRARFNSKCPRCHKAIHEGDEILKRDGDQQYSHETCPTGPIAAAIDPGVKGSGIAWIEPPDIPEEAIEEVKAATFDADTLMHQFYDDNPFLDMLPKRERMETLYGKRVTIPMNAATDTRKDQIRGLRREADRLEKAERKARKAQKRREKAARRREADRQIAFAALRDIAADGRRVSSADRIAAARALLEL